MCTKKTKNEKYRQFTENVIHNNSTEIKFLCRDDMHSKYIFVYLYHISEPFLNDFNPDCLYKAFCLSGLHAFKSVEKFCEYFLVNTHTHISFTNLTLIVCTYVSVQRLWYIYGTKSRLRLYYTRLKKTFPRNLESTFYIVYFFFPFFAVHHSTNLSQRYSACFSGNEVASKGT